MDTPKSMEGGYSITQVARDRVFRPRREWAGMPMDKYIGQALERIRDPKRPRSFNW